MNYKELCLVVMGMAGLACAVGGIYVIAGGGWSMVAGGVSLVALAATAR